MLIIRRPRRVAVRGTAGQNGGHGVGSPGIPTGRPPPVGRQRRINRDGDAAGSQHRPGIRDHRSERNGIGPRHAGNRVGAGKIKRLAAQLRNQQVKVALLAGDVAGRVIGVPRIAGTAPDEFVHQLRCRSAGDVSVGAAGSVNDAHIRRAVIVGTLGKNKIQRIARIRGMGAERQLRNGNQVRPALDINAELNPVAQLLGKIRAVNRSRIGQAVP